MSLKLSFIQASAALHCDVKTNYYSVLERHPYLIFSDRYSIRKLTLHKSQFFGIVPNLAGTIAVDYHFSDGLMYWTDVKNESIQRARLHHPSKENIIKETIVSKVRTPDGIAVDWVTGKLYWTDAWAKKIEVSHMDGKDRRALIDTNLDMPRAIVLHPNTGLVLAFLLTFKNNCCSCVMTKL